MLHVRGVPKVKMYKVLVSCVLLCIVAFALTGCRNNLVNEWENYSGDMDVYYSAPSTTSIVESSVSENEKKILSVSEYGIPDYWEDELLTVVADSNKAISATKGNCTSFLWYNDSHLSYSARRSTDLLKYLQDKTNVQFVNFGGDIVSVSDEVEHDDIIAQLNEWRAATLALSNHHSVVGNHDDGIDELANREDLFNFLLKDEPNKATDTNNKFCYYVDNSEEKTRYIYLSTGFDQTTSDDIRFLVNTLNSTSKDWHIVVVSHIWFAYSSTLTPTVGEVPEFAQTVLNVLDDYNARTEGKEQGVTYSFSAASARVEFCIGGHTHVDFEFYTDGGIPVVLNETDSYHLRGEGKGLDKTDEASVSVVVADYEKGSVHIIRAGRGDSRIVPLSNN